MVTKRKNDNTKKTGRKQTSSRSAKSKISPNKIKGSKGADFELEGAAAGDLVLGRVQYFGNF